MPLFGGRSEKDQGSENTEEARAVETMTRLFPTCPVCGEDAHYRVQLRLLGEHVNCDSCTAKWALPGSTRLREGKRPDALTLLKPDKEQRARALKGKAYSVYFWQHCSVEEYDRSTERRVKRLAEGFQEAFVREEAHERPLENLRELGINGLLEVIDIATGSKKSLSRERGGCLFALGVTGDKKGEQALIHVLGDEDEEMRIIAAYSLVQFHKTTGSYEAVPSLTDRLRNDRSALVRSRTAAFLSEIQGDERVIRALNEALEDRERPAGGESMAAGSWFELLSKAARLEVPPSVSDQAKWALEKLGYPAGDTFKEGIQAFQDGQYDEAIGKLQNAIEQGGSSERIAQCHKILGNAYLKKASYGDAIECQKKATEIDPEDFQAWVNLGVAYRTANRLEEAEDCYNRALDIEPEYAKLHQSLGVLYILRDEPRRGVSALEEAVQLDPQLPAAHGNLALAYAKTGQFKRAKSSLTKSRRLGYTNWKAIRRMINELR
ncbi:MAG: tetratricopeptide repeat protein [Anaerolineae bacterium]|jgi:tetratricopeptide (TPR) repeat protein